MKKLIVGMIMLNSFSLFAQEKDIEELTIKGRKKVTQERREFIKNAQSTETLGEEDLNRNNAAMIEQALGTMAGVQVDKRTNIGGQRIVLRGYGNDQKFNNWGVKMYLNGIPLTNADGVTVLEDLDFSLVNNIEVIKGPAATLYGGGVGGVVRFYVRPTTEKGTSISEKLTFGSFKLFQSITKVESVSENASLLFNYGHIESAGYRPTGNTLKNNYAFLGNFKINAKQKLSVYGAHNNSYEGVPGQISYNDYYAGKDPGNTAYIRKNAGNKFISNRAYITHDWDILKNLNNKTSVFFSNLDVKRIAAGAYETSENPNYGYRTHFNLKNSISADFSNQLEFGMEYLISKSLLSNYRFSGSLTNPLEFKPIYTASYFKYHNANQSIFAVEKITFHPWSTSLVVGISGNQISYHREDLLAPNGLVTGYNKDLSFSKQFPIVFTSHIALQKSYKNQIFNLSYSEGYNAPTASTAFVGGNVNAVNDNLRPEKAKMWDFSVQGLIAKTKLDYQISLFNINIENKLTQIRQGTTTYWANTGKQRNSGLEVSVGYLHTSEGFVKKIQPFMSGSFYDFKYQDFKTMFEGKLEDYTNNKIVGVPKNKWALGFDVETKIGLYWVNTFTCLGDVYADFKNENLVKGFSQYNAKIGYKKTVGNWDVDVFLAGNNLTSQINYTFLFLGNNINDTDPDSNYVGQKTDITPGSSKAYFFGGVNVKYRF